MQLPVMMNNISDSALSSHQHKIYKCNLSLSLSLSLSQVCKTLCGDEGYIYNITSFSTQNLHSLTNLQ